MVSERNALAEELILGLHPGWMHQRQLKDYRGICEIGSELRFLLVDQSFEEVDSKYNRALRIRRLEIG